MNQEYVIEAFTSVLPKEYKIKLIEKKYIRAFYIQENLSFSIYLGDFQDYLVTNLVASIEYKVVEELYDTKFKLGKGNYTINDQLLWTLFDHEISDQLKKSLPISLSTEEGVTQACELIKMYYEQVAVPFFNYFKDVRALLPFIENADLPNLHKTLLSDGIMKKAILWKLCNHSRFMEFKSFIEAIYNEDLAINANDKSALKGLEFFKQLEDVKPIYNWDDIYLIAKPFNI